MKIGVFGNCQTDGMAASFRVLTDAEVVEYTVQKARVASEEELQDAARMLGECDYIFTQPVIIEPFPQVSFETLKALCDNTIAFPHLATTTLQPDCHYIRDNGVAQNGPMGPYHSAIIAACFLMGIPARRVASLFNKYVYASLGYLSVPLRHQPMIKDAEAMDYDYSEFLSGRHGRFMHTLNHPTASIIFSTAQQALKKAGLEAKAAECPEDKLEHLGVWPVYPEIGQQFGIEGSLVFKQRKSLGKTFTLNEVIEAFYAEYEVNKPTHTPQIDKAIALFQEELV